MKDVNEVYTEFLEVMTMPDGRSAVPEGMLEWLKANGFFEAPASTTYHGSHPGGLAKHSTAVTECLLNITAKMGFTWEREESPYLVGMFHDLCKIDCYEEIFGGYQRREDCLLGGHGEKSVMLLSQFTTLTEEEILCIRYHMGAFVDPKHWNDYGRAVETYKTVLWTHTADMLASRVMGV